VEARVRELLHACRAGRRRSQRQGAQTAGPSHTGACGMLSGTGMRPAGDAAQVWPLQGAQASRVHQARAAGLARRQPRALTGAFAVYAAAAAAGAATAAAAAGARAAAAGAAARAAPAASPGALTAFIARPWCSQAHEQLNPTSHSTAACRCGLLFIPVPALLNSSKCLLTGLAELPGVMQLPPSWPTRYECWRHTCICFHMAAYSHTSRTGFISQTPQAMTSTARLARVCCMQALAVGILYISPGYTALRTRAMAAR